MLLPKSSVIEKKVQKLMLVTKYSQKSTKLATVLFAPFVLKWFAAVCLDLSEHVQQMG